MAKKLVSYAAPFAIGFLAMYALMVLRWVAPDIAWLTIALGFFCIGFAFPEVMKSWNEYSYNILTPFGLGAIVVLMAVYVTNFNLYGAYQVLTNSEYFGMFTGAILGCLFALLVPLLDNESIYLYTSPIEFGE
jgi:hypothetical protein